MLWIRDRQADLVRLLGEILVVVTAIWVETGFIGVRSFRSWAGAFFVLGIGCIVTGNVLSWKRTPRLSRLVSRNADLEENVAKLEDELQRSQQAYSFALERQLSILAKNVLHFSDTERISIYKRDKQGFSPLARYSEHPEYTKPSGRALYPLGEGCIGFAWERGEAFEDALPDPGCEPAAYYHCLQSRWKLDTVTVQKMRMKSRSYAAFAVYDVSGDTRIAVVVFESARIGVLDRDKLREVLRTTEGRRISHFIEDRRRLEPTPSFATEEGY